MLTTTVFELYDAARCTLWVEDDLTRGALTTFWEDNDIRILSAAGRTGVEHLTRAAPEKVKGRSVIGLVDSDFSHYDPLDWQNLAKPILFTPTHEFENLLLDFDVLAAIAGQPRADVETTAKTFAENIKWWMACKRVLHELFGAVTAHFPGDPGLPPGGAAMSQQAAVDHINGSPYRKDHQTALRTWDEAYVERKVNEWGDLYDAALASGTWVDTFSGKEIFRHVRSNVRSLAGLATPDRTPAQNDEDLAIRMVRLLKRRFSRTSPTAQRFSDLRTTLRTRAGLTP